MQRGCPAAGAGQPGPRPVRLHSRAPHWPAPPPGSSDYLYLNLLIGPYHPHEAATHSSNSTSSAGRRRLAAWVAQALAARDASAGGLPAGTHPHVEDGVQADLAHAVRRLMHKPKLTLAHRRRQHRRLLTEDDPLEAEAAGEGGELPQLKVRAAAGDCALGSSAPQRPQRRPASEPVLPLTSGICTCTPPTRRSL